MHNNRSARTRYSAHDPVAEAAVLGCALRSPERLDVVVELIPDPAAFYLPEHRQIYRAIAALYHDGRPVDLVTVADQIGQRTLREVGGRSYLVELLENGSVAENVEQHARIVARRARQRQLDEVCRRISMANSADDSEPDETLQLLDRELVRLSDPGLTDAVLPLKQISDEFAERILSGQPAYTREDYLLTRINDLNGEIIGMFRGDLIIVCAPVSGGKTSFLLDLAFYNAIIANRRVCYFAIDETVSSINQRLYSASTGWPQKKFTGHKWDNEELEQIRNTRQTIGRLEDRFFLTDRVSELGQVRLLARQIKRRSGLDMVIVDYLQQLSGHRGRHYENRNIEMTAIVRELKLLAKELHIPVVLASQYSRQYEQDRASIAKGIYPYPQTRWLRDSGSIEQEANLVLGLTIPALIAKRVLGEDHETTRAEFEKNEPGICDAEIVIMKNKMGRTGTIHCKFNAASMQFFTPSFHDYDESEPANHESEVPS